MAKAASAVLAAGTPSIESRDLVPPPTAPPAEPVEAHPGSVLCFPSHVARPEQLQSQDPAGGLAMPAPRLGSSLPDPSTDPYSLLEDMRLAQTAATGPKEKVALYQFPSFVAVNIRRVLSRSRTGKGDWSVALSCLLWQGLCRYNALPAVRDLSTALQALDLDDDLGALATEQIEGWRRGFKLTITDPTHHLGLEKTRSWKAPEHVHSELFDMGARIGLSGSTLGVVAVMAGLVDPEPQPGVIEAHAAYMRSTIAELDGLLIERSKRLVRLVRAIDDGVFGP